MNKLKFGIPKGSLEKSTVSLFEKAGWKINVDGRSYFPDTDDENLECTLCRAQEMSRYVENGTIDAGLTGKDWIQENESDVIVVDDLIYSKVSQNPARWVLAVAADSGIKSLEDLNQDKFIVANLNNPQMADRAAAIFPKTKVVTFDTPSGQFLAVKSGRAHALQIDTPTADYFAASSANDFEVLPTLLTASQNNGIYMKPGDFKWWLWLDTFVSELRTGSLYPKYTELYQKWFKKDPPPQKFYLPQSR